MNQFVVRTFTGVVVVILIIASVVFHPIVFAVFFMILVTLGLSEFYSLIEKTGIKINKFSGTLLGLSIFITNAAVALNWFSPKILLVNFFFVFLIYVMVLYRKHPDPFTTIAFTFLGVIYVAIPLSLISYIPNPTFEPGTYQYSLVLGFFIFNWVNDSGAYLVGSKFGKHKLFERISPRKTWEGLAGGILFTLLSAWVLSLFFLDLTLIQWIGMAVIVNFFSTYGDLLESVLKRSINKKDSGSLLPGHGGILDRFDGVLVSAPFVFVYLIVIA
ncbi:MAG: phosphatidate cytidylyltransferase [Bacteroidales bacterium]